MNSYPEKYSTTIRTVFILIRKKNNLVESSTVLEAQIKIKNILENKTKIDFVLLITHLIYNPYHMGFPGRVLRDQNIVINYWS